MIFCSSYYRIRTSFYIYAFSAIGCLFLYLYLILYSILFISIIFIVLCGFIPFIIKIPTYPFYYWLPEVHCEVNTSISLFLAGLLLKLGVFGILRFIFNSLFLFILYISCCMISYCLIGIFIVLGYSFRCFDIKKIIGFSSILHLNIILVSICLINYISLLCGIITSISHGFCSICLFIIASLLINKSYSRYMDNWFYIDYGYMLIIGLIILYNLSFPICFNFIAELLCFICLLEIDCYLLFVFIFILYLNYWYWFIIMNKGAIYSVKWYIMSSPDYLLVSILWLLFIGFIWYI